MSIGSWIALGMIISSILSIVIISFSMNGKDKRAQENMEATQQILFLVTMVSALILLALNVSIFK